MINANELYKDTARTHNRMFGIMIALGFIIIAIAVFCVFFDTQLIDKRLVSIIGIGLIITGIFGKYMSIRYQEKINEGDLVYFDTKNDLDDN